MLTRARIASATASASAAVDFGCCLTHTFVAFVIVYLFQIDSSLDVHATPRSCGPRPPVAPGRTPLLTLIFVTQALLCPRGYRALRRVVYAS
jgi:hypothetical protein